MQTPADAKRSGKTQNQAERLVRKYGGHRKRSARAESPAGLQQRLGEKMQNTNGRGRKSIALAQKPIVNWRRHTEKPPKRSGLRLNSRGIPPKCYGKRPRTFASARKRSDRALRSS